MVSLRKKQVRREQENKDDRELSGKPKQRPPPEKGTGGSDAGTSATAVGAIARPGQRRGGGVSRPSSTKHGLASRPHSKEMNDWPGRKDGRHKKRAAASSARSLSYRSLAENDSLRFAPAAIDHLLKRTRLPLASSGKRFLSHLVLAALRALTRRKNTPSMAGSCKGGKRIVRQKKHHHSRHALILPFFMFLLPLTAKKNIFIAEPLAESLLFAAAGDRAY